MRSALAGLLLLALSGSAAACGYCVEDKVASVYDHAVVTRALERNHHVAYFHVDGALPYSLPAVRNIEATVGSTEGIDARSTRFAPETMTLAFAFDPARNSLAAVQARLEKRLAAYKLTLMPFQVLQRPGDLRSVQATQAPRR